LLDHSIEIWIAGAKAPGQPVATPLSDPLAVSDNLELAGLARRKDGFNVEALLNEGHETRDLGLVVLSCRAVNDLDLHLFSKALLKFYALTRFKATYRQQSVSQDGRCRGDGRFRRGQCYRSPGLVCGGRSGCCCLATMSVTAILRQRTIVIILWRHAGASCTEPKCYPRSEGIGN